MKIISILVSAVAGLDLGAYCTKAKSGGFLPFITVNPRESINACANGHCLLDNAAVCHGVSVLASMKQKGNYIDDSTYTKTTLLEPYGNKRAYDGVNILFEMLNNLALRPRVNIYIAQLLDDVNASGKYALTLSYVDYRKAAKLLIKDGRINDHLLAVFVRVGSSQQIDPREFDLMLKTPGLHVLVEEDNKALTENTSNLVVPEVSDILGQFSHDTAVCK